MNYAEHANAAALQFIFKHLGFLLGLNSAFCDQDQNNSPVQEGRHEQGLVFLLPFRVLGRCGDSRRLELGLWGFVLSAGRCKWHFSLVSRGLELKSSRAVLVTRLW